MTLPGTRLLSQLSKDKSGFVVYPTKLIEAVQKAMVLQSKVFPHRLANNWVCLRRMIEGTLVRLGR
jgi:hypothetical protein